MNQQVGTRNGYRFGPYFLDPSTGDLYKDGRPKPKRLRRQARAVLLELLRCAGEVVEREGLKGLVWKGRKIGDPKRGLNKIVVWIRRQIGDSADNPRYIEVVPGIGFRFIAAVERVEAKTIVGFRFGPFVLDRDTGELYKNGELCKRLRPQAFKVLLELLNRPGEVRKREELVSLLWGKGREPWGGLNKIVGWLRRDLGDSVDHPRHIEVVPHVGIRFIARVEKLETPAGHAMPADQKPQLRVPLQVVGRGKFLWEWVFTHDSERLCICGPEEQIQLYALPTCEPVATLKHKGKVQHLVCYRDLLVSLAFDHANPKLSARPGLLYVWNLRTQQQLDVQVHPQGAEGLVISPGGRWLISIGHLLYSRTLLWKFSSSKGALEFTSAFDYNGVIDAAFSPTDEVVAIAGADGTVRVLNLLTGREDTRLEHQDEVIGVAFSHNGQMIATASKDCTACLWDAASGHKAARFVHRQMLFDVAFSPDDRWITTAGGDFACLWNRSTGDEVSRLCHETEGVLKLAYSPNGTYIATGGCDSTARIWQVPSGQEIARLHHDAYGGEISDVAFSPDGRFLATGGGRDGVAVWAAPS